LAAVCGTSLQFVRPGLRRIIVGQVAILVYNDALQ